MPTMTIERNAENPSARAPLLMRTFWFWVAVCALVLVPLALVIGRYGVTNPVSVGADFKELSSVNVAIWSLVITSIVGFAGSITAVAIASAASRAQELSTRLQSIEVYHNHPAYEKARRVSDAFVSARSTLRLIVTGLEESRSHALIRATANPAPMINRWRTFGSDIHRSIFESELYAYLLAAHPGKTRIIASAVGTLLSTADDLQSLVEQHEKASLSPNPPASELEQALFMRNAMAYVASGELFKVMDETPTIERLYTSFGGQGSPPYTRKLATPRDAVITDGGLDAIRALNSEALVRMHRSTGLTGTTSARASASLALAMRQHYDERPPIVGVDPFVFEPVIYVDFWLPTVDLAIRRAVELALQPDQPGVGDGSTPAVAARAIHVGTLDQCLDHVSQEYLSSPLARDAHALRSLLPLFPEAGTSTEKDHRDLRVSTRSALDELAAALHAAHPHTLFVFELRNELQHAELAYVASKLPRCLLIWTGWPYIPNEMAAFKTLLEAREFTRTDRAGRFPYAHPLIFTGVLPFLEDRQGISTNDATRKLQDLGVPIYVVSDS
jgi:hypothetical protein